MFEGEEELGITLSRFRGGWAATGDGFGTFAATRDEALRRFKAQAPVRYCRAVGCMKRARTTINGVPLCAEHHAYVISQDAVQSEQVMADSTFIDQA